MVHIVINKISVIILLLIGVNSFAQQTDPLFVYKNESNKNLSKLHYFLSTFEPVKLEDCLFASGTFRFQISKEGNISNFEVSGDLPDSLVLNIKKRIFQTEGYWKFSTLAERTTKWFVFPVFVRRQMMFECKPNRAVEETYSLFYKLFGENKIISTSTSYLIFPVYVIWSEMIPCCSGCS